MINNAFASISPPPLSLVAPKTVTLATPSATTATTPPPQSPSTAQKPSASKSSPAVPGGFSAVTLCVTNWCKIGCADPSNCCSMSDPSLCFSSGASSSSRLGLRSPGPRLRRLHLHCRLPQLLPIGHPGILHPAQHGASELLLLQRE